LIFQVVAKRAKTKPSEIDPVRIAAFEIQALKRNDAEAAYSPAQTAAAAWWSALDDSARDAPHPHAPRSHSSRNPKLNDV